MPDGIFIGQNQLGVGVARQSHNACQIGIAAHAGLLVVLDHIGQEDGVGAAVGNMEHSADLMGQGVGDTQKAIGEGHAGQTLGDVHFTPGFLIAVIGFQYTVKNVRNCLFGQRIGESVGTGGNIGFRGMGEGIHAGVSSELGRHGERNIQVKNGQVRRQVEIGQGILDARTIVRNHREGSDFRSGAGGGRNGHENGLLPERRQREGFLHIVEGQLRMFIENPHGFGRINRRAAADGYNHIRLEFTHSFGTFPDGLDGGIRRNAFHNAGFHAVILQYLFCFLQETAPTHGMAAGADEGSLMALQHSQFLNGTITCIDISW